jgi:hypothetical protein
MPTNPFEPPKEVPTGDRSLIGPTLRGLLSFALGVAGYFALVGLAVAFLMWLLIEAMRGFGR